MKVRGTMSIFDQIKDQISAKDAATRYGIHINRNGMARCPFHDDHTPSMKIDQRFHCFGCQASGDVITLTARLFNLSNIDAAKKLIEDFSLPIRTDHTHSDKVSLQAVPMRPPDLETQYRKTLDRAFSVYHNYFGLLKRWKSQYAPLHPSEIPDPRYTEAIQNIDRINYILSVLSEGTEKERADMIIQQREEVIKLEHRISGIY